MYLYIYIYLLMFVSKSLVLPTFHTALSPTCKFFDGFFHFRCKRPRLKLWQKNDPMTRGLKLFRRDDTPMDWSHRFNTCFSQRGHCNICKDSESSPTKTVVLQHGQWLNVLVLLDGWLSYIRNLRFTFKACHQVLWHWIMAGELKGNQRLTSP